MIDLELDPSTEGGGIATLRLKRPEKRNAMTLEMWRSVPDLVERLEADDSVRAVLVAGGDHFSAGADIAEFASLRSGAEGGRSYDEVVDAAERSLAGLSKPTIAVVNGFCIGGGCELALACDIRLAASDARFAITPSKVGLVYSMTATRRVVETVGPAWAKQLLFTGEQVDAATALRIGLVNEVHDEPVLTERARSLATTIAAGAQGSIRSSKTIVELISATTDDESRVIAEELYARGYASADYAEGVAAFVEKRRPVFD